MSYVPWPVPQRRRITISPLFLAVVAVAVGSGVVAWTAETPTTTARLAVFVMVIALWVISVCFHEFGHAYVAHKNGDHGVAGAGYLTLDPLKYTHPLLSIVLPLVFIALGGIGLPGGAVMINRGLVRSRLAQSLVSAVGPAANLVFAVVTLLVVRMGLESGEHLVFWSGLAFFALLQIAVLLLNLLPIPGLDGYGIVEPWLPYQTQRSLDPVKQWGIFVAIGLLWLPAVSEVFWDAAGVFFDLVGADRYWASVGRLFFEFWEPLGVAG